MSLTPSAGIKLLCSALLAAALFIGTPAQADEPDISVASMEIPVAYTAAGTGVYNRIFTRLIEGYQGNVDVTFLPSARFNRAIVSRTVDCDYIAINRMDRWKSKGIAPQELEFIGPVSSLEVVVYLPAEADDVSTVADLSALSLASDVNLLDTVHAHGLKATFALQSQPQMLSMLAARRIDALVGYDFDLDFLSKRMGLATEFRKASLRLATVHDGLVCFKNEKTAAFRSHVRQALAEIQISGWLDAAFAGNQ